jgi:putative insertion element HTH domain-containing protein
VSLSAVADELGVDRTALWRWRRDATFVAELNSRRAELWLVDTDRFRMLLPRALDVLEGAMEHDDVRTALAVVKIAGLGDLGEIGPTDAETSPTC